MSENSEFWNMLKTWKNRISDTSTSKDIYDGSIVSSPSVVDFYAQLQILLIYPLYLTQMVCHFSSPLKQVFGPSWLLMNY